MKYIDADKLIAEILALKEKYGSCVAKNEVERCYKGGRLIGFEDALNIIKKLQQEQSEVDLENYISNKLRELGADLINHKPYSFNRGLNVGKTNAYHDILDKLNARKEE